MADKYTVPLAGPITPDEAHDGPEVFERPLAANSVVTGVLAPRFCVVDLPDGCYRIDYTPTGATGTYRGTLRIDRAEGSLIASGDLYFFPAGTDGPETKALNTAILRPPLAFRRYGIPIYARDRYHSYLKVTGVSLIGFDCRASITLQQYDYTAPPVGSFNGLFPTTPGSRTVTLSFKKVAAPSFLWPGNYYTGTWNVGGVAKGTVNLGWVSSSFRKCTIEVDTLVDAVSPQAVPELGGAGTEDFKTMMASAGWSANVVYDQTTIPKPAGVANHKDCWTDGNLHALMTTIRNASTNLDVDWRMHVLVVPGKMGCSRGKMYDSIGVPREGVVSYSDDGYPSSNSAFFGAAENKMQRQVPRAFLRSASHEVVHGFNQIHQESEGGADNSIMTTTPSVADVLGTAASGDPGVFPTDIKLKVNKNVRHHLIHFPDPVVRPGGHTFASWASTAVPSADQVEIGTDLLTLTVGTSSDQVELGEPVVLNWTLRNTGTEDASVPSEVTTESTYGKITVIDAFGRRNVVAPFVIECEHTHIAPLAPNDELTAGSRVFWSTNGFAFERPGRYTVEVAVEWTAGGIPVTVRGTTPVFVSYPEGASDNAAAANLLHPEVGTWVALGGGAYHLTEAVARIQATMDRGGINAGDVALESVPAVKALRGFAGILPEAR